jgi:hypothetical protein
MVGPDFGLLSTFIVPWENLDLWYYICVCYYAQSVMFSVIGFFAVVFLLVVVARISEWTIKTSPVDFYAPLCLMLFYDAQSTAYAT